MGFVEVVREMESVNQTSELAHQEVTKLSGSNCGSAKVVAVLGIAGMFLYLKFGHQVLLFAYPRIANILHIGIIATISVIVVFAIGFSFFSRHNASASTRELIAEVKARLGLLRSLLDATNEQMRDFEQEMIAHMSLVPARGTEALNMLKRITKAVEQRVLRVEGILRSGYFESYRDAYIALNEKLCFTQDSYTTLIGCEALPALEPVEWTSRVERLVSEIEFELKKARGHSSSKAVSTDESDLFANEDSFFSSEDKIKSTTLG